MALVAGWNKKSGIMEMAGVLEGRNAHTKGERESSYYYVVPTRDTQRSSPKTQRSAQPYAHWA